ncbi:hypothetical protein J6590_094990 [Homalodisca vitripennis]|nr:hypothetical protein J6590_094990 [Homalodisca vitripennis]
MGQRSRFNLYLAVIAANVGAFSLGSLYNWSSPALIKLSAEDSFLPINIEQSSWIGSLIGIGSIFGPFIGGYLVDNIGRKASMIVSVLIGLVAWAIVYFSTSIWPIYISRVIGGLGGGIIFTTVPLYVAEVAEDDVRSALGSTLNFFFASGYLVEYIFGPLVSYWDLVLVSCVAPMFFFLLCPFIPESPYYYIMKNDVESAHKSLKTLRKGWQKKDIERELQVIKVSVEEAMKEKGTLLELISTSTNRKALMLSCGAMTFQQMSGINVVTIVVAVILIAFAGVAMPLTKAYGIKNMLIAWNGSFSGYGPLPCAVKGEVFPPNVKGASSAVTVGYSWGLSFVITKLFPYINEICGMYTVFWIFSVSCFLAVLFSVYIMIDTRDMSLQDIQDLLNNQNKSLSRPSTTPRPLQEVTTIT